MQLFSLREVQARTSLGRSTIYRKVNDGTFPPPLKLSEGCVRWDAEDLETWRAALPRAGNDNSITTKQRAA